MPAGCFGPNLRWRSAIFTCPKEHLRWISAIFTCPKEHLRGGAGKAAWSHSNRLSLPCVNVPFQVRRAAAKQKAQLTPLPNTEATLSFNTCVDFVHLGGDVGGIWVLMRRNECGCVCVCVCDSSVCVCLTPVCVCV